MANNSTTGGGAGEPGTPRWVKTSGVMAYVAVVLVAFMLLTGHGPGRHMPFGGPAAAPDAAMPGN